MEQRFPRGTLPPSAFRALATVAPNAIARPGATAVVTTAEPAQSCDLTTTCPTCMIEMLPEHTHYKCPLCGYRDSCCF